MCKTIETSIATIFVVVLTFYILYPTKPFIAWVILILGSMQVIDAVLWYSIRYKMHRLNLFTSTYLIPTIFAAQIVGIYYFSGYRNKVFEICILSLPLMALKWWWQCNATTIDKNNYLKWCDFDIEHPTRLLYLFMITFPIIMTLDNGFDKFVILSSIYAMFIINFNEDAFGSRWCWSVNIMAIILLVNKIIVYNCCIR